VKLSHKDTVFQENRILEREGGTKKERERERESEREGGEGGESGCLAEIAENCGYALQEPLKGCLPARTIDYRNASHTVPRSRNKSNSVKKR